MNKWVGKKTHANRLRRLKSQYMQEPLMQSLYASAELVRADAQRSIRAGAISGPGHVPSAPGQPPNADTHNLDLSIDIVINRQSKTVQVIARAPYAAALEYGTARIAPRPFMRPALQRNRSKVVYGAVQSVNREIRVYKTSTRDIEAAAEFILGGGTRGF